MTVVSLHWMWKVIVSLVRAIAKKKGFSIFDICSIKYSETWELGTPKRLSKIALNSEVLLFLRSISMYWIGIGTEVSVLNSQVFPISQVVSKTGFTVTVKLNLIPQSSNK